MRVSNTNPSSHWALFDMYIRGEYREDKKSFVESRDSEHFNLSRRTAVAPAERVPYLFEHPIVCLTKLGTIRFTTDSPEVTTEHHQNDILLLPASYPLYTDYVQSSDEFPLECLTLELEGNLINEVTSQLSVDWPDNEPMKDFYTVNDVSEFVHAESCSAIRRIDSLLSSKEKLVGRQDLITKTTQELVLLLLQSQARAALFSPSKPGNRRIEHVVDYIHAHIADDIRIEQLAEQCHMSVSSFYDHFRQSFGASPASFIRQLRIAKARELLLAEPGYSLKQIATDCGFNSAARFSQVFKSMTGESPRSFRTQRQMH